MDTTSVTDSTDWLSTPLSGLAPLESSLRCQVCKDFFTTPMITSCSHTFCSLCIRRYLSQEGRCPACRENDQEMKLRRNWVVEELVTQFTASRRPMLEFARKALQRSEVEGEVERRPAKRRKVNDTRGTDSGTTTQLRSTRSQTKRNATQTTASQETPVSTQEEVEGSDGDAGSVYEDEQPTSSHHFDGSCEPNDGLVACPSCTRRMKESAVNSHLDKCLAGLADEPTSTPAPGHGSGTKLESSQSPHPPHVKAGTIAYAQTKPSSTQRLPTLNYSLFNDNALRKKLKEYGIPNHGSKQLMMKRHMEWVNLFNANCDSLQPVSKLELRKALDQWERTLGRQVEREKGASGVMVKEFDRDRYAQKQKSEFEELIAKARANRGAKRIEQIIEEPVREPCDGAGMSASAERAIDLDGALQDLEQPPSLSNGIGLESVTLPAGASNPAEEDSVALRIRNEPPQQNAETHWQQSEVDVPPSSSQRSMNHDIIA